MAPELLTIIVTSVCCVAFCLVMLLLMLVFYREDPVCCSSSPYWTEQYTEDSLHYPSRHSLIGLGLNGPSAATILTASEPQLPGRLYIIGKPDHYYLNEAVARLPSYESVRKKDRQRQISMISQRFGLSGGHDGAPPTYEETLRQSRDISPIRLHSLDVNLPIQAQDDSSYACEEANTAYSPSSGRQGPSSSYRPALSSRFLSI